LAVASAHLSQVLGLDVRRSVIGFEMQQVGQVSALILPRTPHGVAENSSSRK
jgi:hypothetical protein